jgi:hypothetical protein
MSSQFSYELDERQIKILMQDAELDGHEALWDKFELLEPNANCKTASVQIGNYIPKFNVSISRSVIVPILFIVLIGGLSAMLFSFVDFKKKETIDKEIPLVANPENFKKPEATTAKLVKPVEVKTAPIATVALNTASVINTPTTPAVTVSEPKKEEMAKTPPITSVSAAVIKESENAKVVSKNTSTQAIPTIIKKKKKKVAAEELPTIKAVTNLNEGVSEPELDLK